MSELRAYQAFGRPELANYRRGFVKGGARRAREDYIIDKFKDMSLGVQWWSDEKVKRVYFKLKGGR